MAFVAAARSSKQQTLNNQSVVGALVMRFKPQSSTKAAPLPTNSVAVATPAATTFAPRVRRAVEQGEANRIANGPIVEVPGTTDPFVRE